MRITIEQACQLLKTGKVVALPTETVYGLAASLNNPKAILEIFSLKGRPANNPLIIHLANAHQITSYTSFLPPSFERLAETFWPGPMTLVLPILEAQVHEMVRAGLPTAAFRIPYHPLSRAVINEVGPVVMPSANISGRPSATCAAHVEVDFGGDFPVLDGGDCERGVESTILMWQAEKWTIIRLGALSSEAFHPILGYSPQVSVMTKDNTAPLCPGQLYRHYAPEAHLKLLKKIVESLNGVVIGFSDRVYPQNCRLISLGKSTEPEIAMHRLYAVLRSLDQDGIKEAYVDIDIPEEDLWVTLKERLYKAAKR